MLTIANNIFQGNLHEDGDDNRDTSKTSSYDSLADETTVINVEYYFIFSHARQSITDLVQDLPSLD